MAIAIWNTEAISHLEHIKVVDDNPAKRDAWKAALEAEGYPASVVEGQFSSLDELTQVILKDAGAAICDHDLSPGNFSQERGAKVVAELYKHKFPAILVTRYSRTDIEEIRRFRRYIPILLKPDELNAGVDDGYVADWLHVCREEFEGNFQPSRKPRRTLMQVERVHDSSSVDVVLASWNSGEAIQLPLSLIPAALRSHAQVGNYFHAMVNTGAEIQEELFFVDFETAEPKEQKSKGGAA